MALRRIRHVAGVLLALAVLSPPRPAVAAANESPRVIAAKLDNATYRKAHLPRPDIRIEIVEDLRGVPPDRLTMSARHEVPMKARAAALSEPVADFVKRSFELLLASDSPSPEPVRVALGIEVLDVYHEKTFMGIGDKVTFEGRLAVAALTDSGRVELGWLQTGMESDIGFKIEGTMSKVLYQGLGALALGLARDEVPLPRAGAAGRSPEVGTAERQTAAVEWGEMRAVRADLWRVGGLRYAFHGLTSSSMRDAYGAFSCGMLDVLYLPERGRGHRLGIGFLAGSGAPQPRQAVGFATTGSLHVWEVVLDGGRSRPGRSFRR